MSHRSISTLLRPWATPLTAGAFALLAVTGILMFFHWDTGLNKTAHEWLGWALVIGAAAHLMLHFPSFKRHLQSPLSAGIMGVFLLLLGLSFISLGGGGGGSPVKAVMENLSTTPLITLATVAKLTPEELATRLQTKGITVQNPATDTLQSLTISNPNATRELLPLLFAKP